MLGVLQEPGLILEFATTPFNDPSISLATKRHVSAWQAMGGWNSQVKEGPIAEDPIRQYWNSLDVPMRLRNPLNRIGRPVRLQVFAGDKAVQAWAAKGHELLLRRLAREIGRYVSFPALTESLERERAAAANALEPLWTEQVRLTRTIAAVRARTDNDSAVFMTWGEREQLKELERLLKGHLQNLKDYGVDDATPNIHLIRHIAQQLNFTL